MEPKNDFTQSADNYGEVVGVSAGLGLCAALKRDGKIVATGVNSHIWSNISL